MVLVVMMMTTMTTTLDYQYYNWLTQKVSIANGKQYTQLFEIMHNVEFLWFIPNDDNRIQDAIDLRTEFMNRSDSHGELELGSATCLEVLVSLSRRLAMIASDGGHSKQWAWTLLKNLGLIKFPDPLSPEKVQKVNEILHDLVWRNYQPDGRGGFFPLLNPDTDQTKVEIWYQLNAYVSEMTDL